MAMGLAGWAGRARLAARVPAPASSTVWPASGCGLRAMSSAAIGPWTSSAPVAQPRPAAA
jgi:hypothetical protein